MAPRAGGLRRALGGAQNRSPGSARSRRRVGGEAVAPVILVIVDQRRPVIIATISSPVVSEVRRMPTCLPRRRTQIRSASRNTWSSEWLTMRIARPRSRIRRIRSSTRRVSATPSAAVGSSISTSRCAQCTPRAIATPCRPPREVADRLLRAVDAHVELVEQLLCLGRHVRLQVPQNRTRARHDREARPAPRPSVVAAQETRKRPCMIPECGSQTKR